MIYSPIWIIFFPATFILSDFIHIFFHIYIYIVIHRHCFVVSQLFSVARLTRCFKPKSKSGWLYVSQISYPRIIIIILSIHEGIFMYSFFYIYIIKYWSAQFMRRALHFSVSSINSVVKVIAIRIWTEKTEFKTWTRLFAFYVVLMLLEKTWIHVFPPKIWIK